MTDFWHPTGLGVTGGGDQGVQHSPILVDSPPQVVGLAIDLDEHLIEMSLIPWT